MDVIWNFLITNPMVNLLLFIYSIVHNFGLAIIVFTILIRLITHPLTVSQLKGTQALTDLQKSSKWQDIQKKYKDDKEKLQQEQMKMYQEAGVNPAASCLPTLIQFPIMIGLYQAIIRSLAVAPAQLFDLQLHVYPFFRGVVSGFIPLDNRFLWMDLAQPDYVNVFGIGIPVMAILVVVTTYMQSKMMTPPSSGPNDQSAQMAQSMNLMMPLMMGYFALTFSSGLALYFLVGNIFAVFQYAALGRLNWRNLLPAALLPGKKDALPGKKEISQNKKDSTTSKKEALPGNKEALPGNKEALPKKKASKD